MATVKQKLAFKKMLENRGNASKAMTKAGYSKAMAKNPQSMTRSKGFRELLEKYLPDSSLAAKHKALMNKKEMIVVGIGKGYSKIENTGQPHTDVAKALDMAYKLKGAYPKEGGEGNKTLILVVSGESALRYGNAIAQNSKAGSA